MLVSCPMRRALPEDAEEIAQLELELFPDDWLNAWSIRNELKHSKCWVIGEDRLRAYLLTRTEGSLVDILRVGVRREHQGHGLGYRLVQKALTLAPKAVLMVRKDNKKALDLYHSLGFQIVGEFKQSWTMLTGSCS